MAPRTGTGERYATQMGELWSALARTLTQLDRFAAEPERLAEDDAHTLRWLQYRLYQVGERVYGLAPPAGAASAHAELCDALIAAREATAEVADALEDDGTDGAALVVHEWRGALFRVRLARLRLAEPRRLPAAAAGSRGRLQAPLGASLLVVCGAAAFAFGAAANRWPVWLAGILAVCASALAYRP